MREKYTYKIIHRGKEIEIAANVRHQGPDWVLCMHGIQSNKELFNELLEQSFLSSFSTIALDLVGFGESSKPTDFSYDIQDQANIVEEIVKQVGIQKLHIIGHSLGGMVATLLLNPLQEVIQSFINMEGNLILADCGLSKEVAAQSFAEFQTHYEEIKSKIRDSKTAGCIERATWLEGIPDFAFYKTSKSIVDWSTTGKLLQMFENAQCRKLFIYGSENFKKANCLSKTIDRAEIPNAGHFMLQSNLTACYQAIEPFLLG